MFRGSSKERSRKVTPPGPVYMSNDQFANYLADLRNNRVARPSGARPQPSSGRRDSERGRPDSTQPMEIDESIRTPSSEHASRSASAMSHRRAQSSLSTYSSVTSRSGRQLAQPPTKSSSPERPLLKPSQVVPSGTYIERGQRWMEKEDAVALRDAMEDLDLLKQEEEDVRIHTAAQNEASDLVWEHQHGGLVRNPHAPYSYKEHLRKNSYQHARTQSAGPYNGVGMTTGLGRDVQRSVSGGSSSSGDLAVQGRNSGELDRARSPENAIRSSMDSSRSLPQKIQKPYGSITNNSRPQGSERRRSSARRNISGEISGAFSGEQIWEEPEEERPDRGRSPTVDDVPRPLRIKPRDPMNRVQFVQDLSRSSSTPATPTVKLYKSEIHRNPPSQSRNPEYTANTPLVKKAESPAPEVAIKDGLEIRSDDIRQATSMRMKDRSPKLPTPTAVSDKPGRPIVSFDKNWKPSEADVKPEERRQAQFQGQQRQGITPKSHSANVAAAVSTIHLPDTPSIQVNSAPPSSIPTINLPDSSPSVPTINLPDSSPNIPTINFPDSAPSIPTINLPDAPTISISTPAPSINITDNSRTPSARPLPDPKKVTGRPLPRHHATAPLPRGHWSPAGKRATATCHQCQLPIEGRVVGLRGAPEKYHPECFICFTCGTGLEALEVFEEPPVMRAARLDRIQRRALGEPLPEIEGETYAEDGDERLRYFCHLDWHELYAPKCKHCKTPILGEHMIALGEHWHFGHFFCAECGDPFEKGMSHIEKDGYAWCLSCQTKRTERRAPKCKKCKLPVIGEAIQALGGEWHDKCFRCITCKGDFPDGSFFPKQVGQEITVTCTRCMEMELKA